VRKETLAVLDEWQAEFERNRVELDPQAKTIAELAEGFGRSRAWTQEYVSVQVKAGRYTRTRKLVERNGYMYPVSAYRIVKK
jgi:hypothetical protein